MKREAPPLGRPPDAARLREAALAHLARFAATEAGLALVLTRRVDRWVRAATAAGLDDSTIDAARRTGKAAVPGIIDQLRLLGALNDAGFAAARATRLSRSGKSRLATLAHLAARGVEPEIAAAAVPADPARDLAAACAYLRRRRLPPFGPSETPPVKALAALARAGFGRDIAERALHMDTEAAESLIIALRER